MSFPEGPFFNFRLPEELKWYQKLIIILLGEKRIAQDINYKVTAYYFKGITYIRNFESVNKHNP